MTPHVAYGGAQLFAAGTAEKWRSLALAAFEEYVPTAETVARRFEVPEALAEKVRERVALQLRDARALASLRIDFEDGYGLRPDEEEDASAERAGQVLAMLTDPPDELGIRPKGFAPTTRARALRTLSRFFAALTAPLPEGFVVTLAKVQNAHEVSVAVGALSLLEARHGMAPLAIELMAETPGFFAEIERHGLERLHAAAEGRLRSVHFGAYDMLSALGVAGHTQSLSHPFCTPLRLALARAAAPLELPVYDGATLAMPVAPHRGGALDDTQRTENHTAVLEAMAAHAKSCDAALSLGLAGSWDLHPAQLVPRHIATTAFYLRALAGSQKRLAAFLTNAARATRAGQEFDDAASARGLLRFLARGLSCGALVDADLGELPITVSALRTHSFDELVATL